MDDDEEIEVPVLRLYPLPGEETEINNRRTKSARYVRKPNSFQRSGSFRSDSLSRSETPERLIFPGHERPRSAACLLRELNTPVKGRQRNSLRQSFETDEMQHVPEPPKKVTHEELEIIVSRLQRQTNSGRARTALTRRINQKKAEPSQNVRIDYLAFDPLRFRGLRKVSKSEMEEIVSRLSSFPKDRKPAESERYYIAKQNHEKLGVLNSYRWKGIRNC